MPRAGGLRGVGGRGPGQQHTGARTRSLGLVGLAIVGSGLLVNAYLAIIARSISAAEYAYFGAFWSLALVVGFGVFLPIEQETARLMQVPDRPRGLLRAALLTASRWPPSRSCWSPPRRRGWPAPSAATGSASSAIAVLCVISAGQFVVRGALIGMDRMGRYALIISATRCCG